MSYLRSKALGAALAGALLAAAVPARGGTPADEATASALFQDGKSLFATGAYEQALSKYQEAQRLSPTSGTLLNVALCLERLGRLASAWGTYKLVEVQARNTGDADREREAQRRAEALAPSLAKLAIVVPPATHVPGLEVRKDGELVGEGQWGTAVPADIGQHTVEATAPGRKPWSTVVRIETNGSAASVEVPALDVQAAESSSPAPFWNGQRIAGASVAAVGLAGLVVGSVTGALTLSKTSDAKAYCSATLPYCTPQGIADENSARTLAHASDAAFAIGGAAVVAGVVTILTVPSGVAKTTGRVLLRPLLGTDRVGVVIDERW